MALTDQINADIKAAMIAKDQGRLAALRAIKSALLLLQTSGQDVTEELEIKELQKLLKQRNEASEVYRNNDRPEQAQEEEDQAAVIKEYLPQMMSENEIRSGLEAIVAELGVSSMADMGKVMGAASNKFAGKADNKQVSEVVRSLLSSQRKG